MDGKSAFVLGVLDGLILASPVFNDVNSVSERTFISDSMFHLSAILRPSHFPGTNSRTLTFALLVYISHQHIRFPHCSLEPAQYHGGGGGGSPFQVCERSALLAGRVQEEDALTPQRCDLTFIARIFLGSKKNLDTLTQQRLDSNLPFCRSCFTWRT